MCGSRKYPNPHHRGLLEILRGRGVLKAKMFKERNVWAKKLEFPEGSWVQTRKTLCGGSMDFFWKNTIFVLIPGRKS